jgi:hypothetical protein
MSRPEEFSQKEEEVLLKAGHLCFEILEFGVFRREVRELAPKYTPA